MDETCHLCDDTKATETRKPTQAYTAKTMPAIAPSSFGAPGMKNADRPSRNVGKSTSADLTASRPKPKLKKVLPEIWKLMKPRWVLLCGSFLLMIVNRASGLILPASTRY